MHTMEVGHFYDIKKISQSALKAHNKMWDFFLFPQQLIRSNDGIFTPFLYFIIIVVTHTFSQLNINQCTNHILKLV